MPEHLAEGGVGQGDLAGRADQGRAQWRVFERQPPPLLRLGEMLERLDVVGHVAGHEQDRCLAEPPVVGRGLPDHIQPDDSPVPVVQPYRAPRPSVPVQLPTQRAQRRQVRRRRDVTDRVTDQLVDIDPEHRQAVVADVEAHAVHRGDDQQVHVGVRPGRA
jgi:hypothetical protein